MTKNKNISYLDYWKNYREKNREKLRKYNTDWQRNKRKKLSTDMAIDIVD